MIPKVLKLSTIGLLLMLILIACRKDDDPEPEHFTITIYIDSLVINDAQYITHSDSVVTFDDPHIEEFRIAPVNSTVIFEEEESIAVKYLGGWRNPDPFEPDVIIDPIIDLDVVYDTIYETRIVEASYAILEITTDSETRIDTAILDRRSFLKQSQEVSFVYAPMPPLFEDHNEDVYLGETLIYFKSWENSSYGSFFYAQFSKTFYSIPLSNQKYAYLIDIYPYWQEPISSADLVFYINN